MLSWDDFDDKEKMKEPVLAKKNLDEEKKNRCFLTWIPWI